MGGASVSKTLVSLFCGACSIESKVKGFEKIICNDNQKYLIALFQALQNGYDLPELISEEEYYFIKDNKDINPALTGFVGFACSFGGKWFGGYARDSKNTNYALRGKNSLIKKMETLKKAKFICLDYKDVYLPESCVIYADPPYNNTTKYYKNNFNSLEFWEYMREISDKHLVYISELKAPKDFYCIWQKNVKRILDVNTDNRFESTEKLFVHKNNIGLIN